MSGCPPRSFSRQRCLRELRAIARCGAARILLDSPRYDGPIDHYSVPLNPAWDGNVLERWCKPDWSSVIPWALWCNWLTRRPLKAESTGSIPVSATNFIFPNQYFNSITPYLSLTNPLPESFIAVC
jgi:hypothetical protein